MLLSQSPTHLITDMRLLDPAPRRHTPSPQHPRALSPDNIWTGGGRVWGSGAEEATVLERTRAVPLRIGFPDISLYKPINQVLSKDFFIQCHKMTDSCGPRHLPGCTDRDLISLAAHTVSFSRMADRAVRALASGSKMVAGGQGGASRVTTLSRRDTSHNSF
jgi:hypothetical protein